MLNSILINAVCQMARLAYHNQDFFDENFEKEKRPAKCECFDLMEEKPKLIESGIDTECYVSVFNNNSILCAFRGTENIRDWLTDANIVRVPMDLEGVEDKDRPLAHWGFLRQFRSVESKITDFINAEIQKNTEIKNIIYTGHSKGGGEAVIACMNYAHKYPGLKHACVTFGAPRVGNRAFKERFNRVCNFEKRYVLWYDPVPSLPFSLRYCHTCPSEYINTSENIIQQVETKVSRFFWVLYYKFAHWCGSAYNPIDDHSILYYRDKLKELLKDDDEEN